MPNTLVKLYRIDETTPPPPLDLINDVTLSRDSPFDSVKVVDKTDGSIDVEATWVEERLLKNVVSRGTTHDISIKVLKHGWLRYDFGTRIVLASSLGKYTYRLLSDLWGPKCTPIANVVSFDLRRALARNHFRRGADLDDVRIIDLPVDEIPAMSAVINNCTKNALLSLIKGTPAIIDRFTTQYKENIIATIIRSGSIRIASIDSEWQELAAITAEIADKLNLVGGN